MKLAIVAVGKLRAGPERQLFEHFAGRLKVRPDVREVDAKRPGPAAEAALLLAAVPAGARLVALDERGVDLSSRDLAGRLGGWRDDGNPAIAFVIGGADGLHESVRVRADLVLALGRLTWPHMLVRAMVAEQLYRIETILEGHPYHRD